MLDFEYVTYEGLTIFYKFGNLEAYPPQEDSFMLASSLKAFVRNKEVLDLGCGTGILGLVSLKNHAKSVTFSDIDS